jgi:hypothetical protein
MADALAVDLAHRPSKLNHQTRGNSPGADAGGAADRRMGRTTRRTTTACRRGAPVSLRADSRQDRPDARTCPDPVRGPDLQTDLPRRRDLPKDPDPSFMSYSIGRWDGDTLVVETIG